MFLPLITKNLKRKILNKNLVTFKRWDGVKDEKFQYYADSLKTNHEKLIYRRKLPKKGELGKFADFLSGVGEVTPQCTL